MSHANEVVAFMFFLFMLVVSFFVPVWMAADLFKRDRETIYLDRLQKHYRIRKDG